MKELEKIVETITADPCVRLLSVPHGWRANNETEFEKIKNTRKRREKLRVLKESGAGNRA